MWQLIRAETLVAVAVGIGTFTSLGLHLWEMPIASRVMLGATAAVAFSPLLLFGVVRLIELMGKRRS